MDSSKLNLRFADTLFHHKIRINVIFSIAGSFAFTPHEFAELLEEDSDMLLGALGLGTPSEADLEEMEEVGDHEYLTNLINDLLMKGKAGYIVSASTPTDGETWSVTKRKFFYTENPHSEEFLNQLVAWKKIIIKSTR